jgi:hypothetical protein
VQEAFLNKELLDTEDVAGYLGVSPVSYDLALVS